MGLSFLGCKYDSQNAYIYLYVSCLIVIAPPKSQVHSDHFRWSGTLQGLVQWSSSVHARRYILSVCVQERSSIELKAECI